MATWAFRAGAGDEASTLTPRMKETRAIAARLLDPKGVSDMSLAPDGKHAVAIAWTGQANALLLIDTDTGNSSVLVKPEVRSGWRGAVIQPIIA